jgi:DnaJ-domain-containing protein 1
MTGPNLYGSIMFFYIFFSVLIAVILYGLWDLRQAHLQEMPNPLSAVLQGIPESINLFEDVNAMLRVKNMGKTRLKKIKVVWGSTLTFSLEPGAYKDIPIHLDTYYAGKHQLKARVYYKHWELYIHCMYRVFQRKISPKEKYLRILGLKLGASTEEIKKARNKLAKKYHPDTETGDEEKMKEINEAYHQLIA